MNEAAAKLSSRVVRWVVAASLATTLLLVGLIPDLLLLRSFGRRAPPRP